ncbi:MAG: phage antirepressor KilAC domain-containing protein [Anaerovoracaceae bacterium]
MSKVKEYKNEEFGAIRTTEIKGDVYFIGKDIAEILGYTRPDHAISKYVDEDDKLMYQIDTSGQKRLMFIINESGLYSLILSSKMPKAKKFKRWVTSEVLPQIRKYGAYATEEKIDEIIKDPDSFIKILVELREERHQREELQRREKLNLPKVIFAEAVDVSDTTILIGELAKILKGNGIEIGQNRLFEKLRQDGYLIKRKGTDYNAPTQMAMELGLFKVKETAITHADGHVTISKTTKVTGKGQQYFINRFLGKEAQNEEK